MHIRHVVAVLLVCLLNIGSLHAISVGPTGTGILTFDTQPAVTDWSTLSLAGGGGDYADAATLDEAVKALLATDISTALGSSGTIPPSANSIARRNTSGNYLQSRPTGNGYLVFMASLTNDTGSAASIVKVSYDFTSLTNDITEEIPGLRAFYSLSGQPGSWQAIPELTTGTSGALSVNLRLATPWAPGAPLFLLWADDNGSGGTGATGQEGTYTIDNFEVVTIAGGTPLFTSFRYSAVEFVGQIEDGTPSGAVDPNTVVTTLNGNPVTTQNTKAGTITTVTYRTATPFPAGSTNDVVFTFYSNPAQPQTATRTFVVDPYTVVPTNYAATGVDTTKPGFKVRMTQIPVARTPGDVNSIVNAEKQLADGYIDPATGNPYANEADLTLADPATGLFLIPGIINWNYTGEPIGNFTATNTVPYPDDFIPGLPGINYSTDHAAAEIITMLDLKAGFYRMGVNSDDGFKVTVGPNPRDAFAMVLGSFNGGRGSADSLFDFIIEADGVYPFRLAWWQGTGGANLEWFIVDTNGKKILINDRTEPAAVKAYITEPPAPVFVKLLTPAAGASSIDANATITIVLSDASTQVQQNSIQLVINDLPVTPVITKSGVNTTIFYDPPQDFKPEQVVNVKLTFSDNSTPAKVTTHQYSFQIKPIVLVPLNDTQMWRYDRSGTDLGTAWYAKNFNDSSWPQGPALIGQDSSAVEPIRTPVDRYNDNGEFVTTFYFRTHFNFTGNPGAVRLFLRHVIDDGAVFYLNGVQVYSFLMPATWTYATYSTTDHENAWEGPFEIPTAALVPGDNVLAVEVHQSSGTSSDFMFGAELLLSTVNVPRTTLASITPVPNSVDVTTNTPIQIVLTDGTEEVQASSIQLKINGQTVAPTVTKAPGDFVTRVTYLPAEGFIAGTTVAVNFSYSDAGIPAASTNFQYSFQVRPDFRILFAVDENQTWKYENSGQTNLGTAWYQKNFDDSQWLEGKALFAWETGATAEPIRTEIYRQGADGNNIITDYFRTRFTFNGDLSKTRLRIRHVVDDGFALYLNGVEVYRFYLPETGPIDATTLAVPSDHENTYEGPFYIDSSALVIGENVLAAEVHQNSATSSDVVFGLELQAVNVIVPPEPPAFTSATRSGDSLVIQWTGTGTLQSADTLTGQWTDIAGATSPYTTPATGSAKFFRIKQ